MAILAVLSASQLCKALEIRCAPQIDPPVLTARQKVFVGIETETRDGACGCDGQQVGGLYEKLGSGAEYNVKRQLCQHTTTLWWGSLTFVLCDGAVLNHLAHIKHPERSVGVSSPHCTAATACMGLLHDLVSTARHKPPPRRCNRLDNIRMCLASERQLQECRFWNQ